MYVVCRYVLYRGVLVMMVEGVSMIAIVVSYVKEKR